MKGWNTQATEFTLYLDKLDPLTEKNCQSQIKFKQGNLVLTTSW